MPQFLSDAWVAEANKIRESHAGESTVTVAPAKINLNIVECPDGVGTDGTVAAHMDSSGGQMEMDLGHLDAAEATVTVDYATAKSMFVDNNPQAAMQAFMGGKIKIAGDMTKVMALAQGAPDPAALAIGTEIAAMTD